MKTINKKNLDGIFKKNPHVDEGLFLRTQRQLDELRKIPRRKFEYDLVIPYSRRVRAATD